MKKKLSSTLQFFAIGFLIAFIINAIVSTAQILYAKDFTFVQTLQIFLFTLAKGALIFSLTYLLLYLLTILLRTFNRGRLFWILLIIGMASVVVAYLSVKKDFIPYTDETGTIVAIAAFSILVSLSSQYQQFIHPEGLDKNLLTEENV
jgi:hypothetical protein